MNITKCGIYLRVPTISLCSPSSAVSIQGRLLNGVWHPFKQILSVDSLCRDSTDTQYMQYLSKSHVTSITNMLKAHLSTQPSSFSAFMISKTHIIAQKPHGRQLNAKVCSSESAIFLSLSFFLSFFLPSDHKVERRYLENGSSTHRHFITKLMLTTVRSFTATQRLHSYEFIPFDKTVLSSARLLSVA